MHRWFGYVEGFSADYLATTLDEFADDAESIFDPFGGTGTALLEASQRGITSFFAEANPFMAFVINAKVNGGSWAARNRDVARAGLNAFGEALTSPSFVTDAARIDIANLHQAFANRPFFEDRHLRQLVRALQLTDDMFGADTEVGQLARLACAANIVDCSHMTRRADLRRRRPDEYKTRVVDVPRAISTKVVNMIADLDDLSAHNTPTAQVADDCRALRPEHYGTFDLAITSPPYLNGTNYIRNTKLELLLLGFVESETELGGLRDRGMCAGITQARTSRPVTRYIDDVELVAKQLDVCAADRRVPHLVRCYFADMYDVLRAVYRGLRRGARFVLDIGDSCFYGIHVPTDRLLVSMAQDAGFLVERDAVIARRHSRDKTPLVQVDLHLRKP